MYRSARLQKNTIRSNINSFQTAFPALKKFRGALKMHTHEMSVIVHTCTENIQYSGVQVNCVF
jgi:hypothetical protein